MTPHRTLAIAVVLAGVAILLVRPAESQQKKKQDSFLNGAPLTLEQVLRSVPAIAPQRLKQAILSRGLDFSLNFENLEKLKAAGATGEILMVIKDKARPEPIAAVPNPPPPPPPKTGGVLITCVPAECEISVGGTAKGTTQGGTLRLSGLSLGTVRVDFNKPGYVGSQAMVTIEADKISPLAAALEPDRATKEAFGAGLFKAMVQALGGDAPIRGALSIQAEGSLTTWAPDGKSTRWTVVMRNRPDRGLLQIKGGGSVSHEIAFAGSAFTTSKSLKGDDARELPADFGLVRDHQLAGLIARLSGSQFKMVSDTAERTAGQNLLLVAEGSTETISISLDNDSRPAQVKFSTATGLGSGIVTYSDYVKTGEIYYPRSMQIKFESRGVDVHFDKVELNPKLKDSDYALKKKFPF